MKLKQGTAKETLRSFLEIYVAKRELEGSCAFFTEDAIWIGTGEQEISFGRNAIREAIQAELLEESNPYGLTFLSLEERAVTQECSSVFCRALLSRPGGDRREAALPLRVTAGCTATTDGCKIASIHFSTPSARQESGSYMPVGNAVQGRLETERRLGANSLDLLWTSIPGGMIGGYFQPGLPLYFINDRMLSYLGYGYEEFTAVTGGMVLNGIHPDDRARVEQTLEAASCGNREYEIQCRMKKKDGSVIWVNAIGKITRSEEGSTVFLSVLRDISAEITARETLRVEAQEKERQARRYDHLFQSVLCGIVQYRLEGTGVRFKNANREAIRIFGYTPEEFWSMKDWDLPALIAEEDRERVLGEVSMLRRVGDKNVYEYRLQQKDGAYCWIIGSAEIILDVDGEELVQSVFLDIDSQKKAELRSQRLSMEVEASNELLRMALEHTSTYEFYYYPMKRLCVQPERTFRQYGGCPEYTDMPESFGEEMVEKDGREDFYRMYDAIHRGERTASSEFYMTHTATWCRTTMSVVRYTAKGEPRFVVGIVEDITKQKEMEEELLEARSRDGLTGLYNKEAGVRMVQSCLEEKDPQESCSLMLLDMDDFRTINEKEGTVFADAVLQEVADILRAETSPQDIQVRLGGDEFMLFVKSCPHCRAVALGTKIAQRVQSILIQKDTECSIRVSIGMCSTDVSAEYPTLYRCAESTLNYAKEQGKGKAYCYRDVSSQVGTHLTQLYTQSRLVNGIDREVLRREEDVDSFALELLGKSKNLDDAVFLLLARVGKSFGLDRVTILDANRDYLCCQYTYQWAKNQAHLQQGQTAYMTAEQFVSMLDSYDEEGLSDRFPDDWPGCMPSCLHAAIWNYGEFAGAMSLEINTPDFCWTNRQRKLLKELVKIVPSFLFKARADAVSRAKSEFLSRMSHEIRTPMNAISGMTTIAKTVLDDKTRAMDCLNKIESANSYLLELINDVLDMSRIESGKLELNKETVDLAQQMQELQALLSPQAQQKHLTFTVENGYKENRLLLADGLRLNQVLVNIVGNAVKFTGDGGRVTARVEPLECSQTGVRLCFSVEDNGIGIDPAAQERIFHAFEQAKRDTTAKYGGTGLGLSISSRLVQMMGGTLQVKSEVGTGSVFFFTLPFDYAQENCPFAPPSSSQEETALAVLTGRRVLLAEDNALNREIAQTILEMNGLLVETAENGREAVELFGQKEPGYFDAVLMDIRMPVMDGLQATKRIRTMGRPDSRTIPILALTANAFGEDMKKSMESGMNGHLSKPIQTQALLHTLADCIQSREPADLAGE